MSRRTITLGTWEGQPIEWLVLKEESYGTLVISEDRIGTYRFDDNNRPDWNSSSLRRFLNGNFFNSAFNDEEKKKIVNVRIDSVKDDVFVLSLQEYCNLTTNEDYFETWCWTKSSFNGNRLYVFGANQSAGADPSECHCVRPAMYIREK